MKPASEPLTVALRGYSKRKKSRKKQKGETESTYKSLSPLPPSRWTVVVDIETTTNIAQAPRFGTYLVFKRGERHEQGVFYNADAITKSDLRTLTRYAAKNS